MTYMGDSVGIRELQQNASSVVARAAAGEELVVTERGRPVARIVPLRSSVRDSMTASGRLRPPASQFELPEPVEAGAGTDTQQLLDDLRS